MKYGIALLGLVTIFSCQSPSTEHQEKPMKEITLLVGTYTERDSEGIYMYKFNPESGESRLVDVASGLENPSFLALAPNKKNIYSVSEINEGSVDSWALGDSTLTKLNSASSGGVHPCHISLDQTGKWVFTGNYSSGSIGVLPVLEDGSIGEPTQIIQNSGSSIVKGRQDGPHVHSVNVSPNNVDIYVPDLGIDQVKAFTLNAADGVLTDGESATVTAGSGPRHFSFHPNGKLAYVLQEITGSITAFNYADGKLEAFQEISSMPDAYEGPSASADIHISADGKFLYASNRGDNSIAIFAINDKNGELSLVSHHSTLGDKPRNFAISPSGKYVLVANQGSDNVVIFERDSQTGKISPTGKEIKVSMPVCLVFAE